MSDYAYQKVLRLPVTFLDFQHNYNKYFKNASDLDDFLSEKFPDIFGCYQRNKFQIAPTEDLFLDYVIDKDFSGNYSGEWSKVRELYPSEKNKFYPLFEKILPNVDMNKVHLVEYCWYDCCEAPSYYSLEKNNYDSFFDEL